EKVEKLPARDAAEKALSAITTLSQDISIPSGLTELGVKEEDLQTMAINAMKDACSLTNPRLAKLDDIIQIYKNAL
ncbi:MAG TPA: iron-containing alcohol dehydrogenase, partial [Desulfitobacterium dehalogenans]|nr:iron-containing alcohol dehydrogenase [Desulfitobacterium dehalogenans]